MKRKNGFTIPLVVVILVIILIGAGITYAVLGTELFKSNKDLFYKYISENTEIFDNLKKDEVLETYSRKLKSTPYTSEGTLKIDESTNISGIGQDDLSKLKLMSVNMTGATDAVNSYDYKNIKLNYSDTSSMTAEYIKSNDHYGIKLNDVLNKYLGFENKNVKEFAKNLGAEQDLIDKIPDKIDLNRYDYSKIFTEEEIETLKSEYLKIIVNNLNDDMFSKSDNVGDKVYTLKLTDTQINKIFMEIITKLKDDDIILGKAKNILINDISLNEEEATSYITKVKEYIQNLIDNQNNESINNGTTEPNEYYINVHVNNKKMVKTEVAYKEERYSLIKSESGFSLENTKNGEKEFSFSFEKTSSADIEKLLISISQKDSEIISLEINIEGLNALDVVKEHFNCTINISDQKIGYKYDGTNTFTTSIDKTITTQDMVTINKANLTQLSSLFDQLSKKTVTVNNTKKSAAGISDKFEPIMYLAIGAIPYESMNMFKTLGPGGTSAVATLSTFLGSMVYDNAKNTVNSANLSSAEIDTFNSMWKFYEGENKTRAEVRTLFSAVSSSNTRELNNSNPRTISITFSDSNGTTKTYTDSKEIENIMSTLSSGNHTYNITMQKDSKGYINSIIVIEF